MEQRAGRSVCMDSVHVCAYVCVCQVARGGGVLNWVNSGDGKTIWSNKSRGSPTSTNHMRSYQFAAGMLFASPQMSVCLPFKRMNECSLHSAGGSGVRQFKMDRGGIYREVVVQGRPREAL